MFWQRNGKEWTWTYVVTWFYQYKYSLLKQSMLKSVRRKVGLGDPPAPFTTNSSESIN